MTDLRLDQMNTGGHGDAAAYLLGALDEMARARFEAHAAGCPECRRDLALLQPVADRLALGVPQVEPPPHLATSIMAAARVVAGALAQSAPPLEAPTPPAPIASFPVVPPRRTWATWSERASAVIAAAALVVALVGSSYAMMQREELQHTVQSAAQLSEILDTMYQPGMTPRTLNAGEGAPQAKGRLFLAPDRTQAVLMAYDLPRLPGTQAYQFWLNNTEAGKRDSGGVFQVDDKGRGRLIVRAPQALAQYQTCGVTREPAAGSKWPTGQRVLGGEI